MPWSPNRPTEGEVRGRIADTGIFFSRLVFLSILVFVFVSSFVFVC